MNLRQSLKEDFGIEALVEGGSGLRDDPFVIEPWTDPRTTFSAIYQIGWLHFDRAINNSQSKDVLDTSLQYSAVGAKAAIYVYDCAKGPLRDDLSAERRGQELQNVCSQVRAIHPNAEAPWPVDVVEPFAMQALLCGEDMTALRHASQETAMAKARKSVAAHKKSSSRRGKTNTKPVRKKMAKRTAAKARNSKSRARALKAASKPQASKNLSFFEVDEYGTISEPDFDEPRINSDIFDNISIDELTTPANIISELEFYGALVDHFRGWRGSASPKLIPEEWQPPGFDIV